MEEGLMNKMHQFYNRFLIIFFILLTLFILSACKPNIKKLKSDGDIEGLTEALTYGCPVDPDLSDRKKYKNMYLRNDAKGALVDLVSSDQVEPLLFLLSNEDYECTHRNVVILLGEIGDERALDPLIGLLDRGSKFVDDKSIVEALGKIGSQRAADAIIKSVDNTDSFTRLTAAKVLSGFGDARAVELLIDLLKDNDVDIRLEALRALRGIGDERAMEPLINLYRNSKDVVYGPERQIKEASLLAVSELKYSEKSTEPLMNLISSISSGKDDQIIYQNLLEISLKLGSPMVEQFIKTYGYKVSDLPYASKDDAHLRDEFITLVRSHYTEICQELQPENFANKSVDVAEYFPKTTGLNKMILLDRDLTPHIWIENLSKEIAPVSASEIELIFILDKAIENPTGRICIMSQGPSKNEIDYVMQIQVFNAQGGTMLYQGEMKQRHCGRISGEPFSFDDFWKWWIKQLEQEALEQEILSKRPDLSLNEFTIEEIANEGLHEYTVSSYKLSELVDEYNASIEIKFAEREVCLTKNGETSCLIRVGENEYTSSDGMLYMALSIDGFFIMNSDREATGSETYFSLIDE